MLPRCQPLLLLPPLTCTKSAVQRSWACPKTRQANRRVTQKCAKQEVLPIETCFIISFYIFVFMIIKSKSASLSRSKRHLQRHPFLGWPAHTTASGRPVATPPNQRFDGDLDFHTLNMRIVSRGMMMHQM